MLQLVLTLLSVLKKSNFLKIFKTRLNHKFFNRQTFIFICTGVSTTGLWTTIAIVTTKSGVETYKKKELNVEAYQAFLSLIL